MHNPELWLVLRPVEDRGGNADTEVQKTKKKPRVTTRVALCARSCDCICDAKLKKFNCLPFENRIGFRFLTFNLGKTIMKRLKFYWPKDAFTVQGLI